MAIYQLANLTSSNNTFTGTNTFNNTIRGSINGSANIASKVGDFSFSDKNLTWDTNSYRKNVILLLPTLTATNQFAKNFIDGTFFFLKEGSNIFDPVRIVANCCYNALNYHIESLGRYNNTGSGKFSLCTCTYNGIKYIALTYPHSDNPYTIVTFTGKVETALTHTGADLPLGIAYYNTKENTVLNSEVNSSLSTTLTDSYITSVNSYALCSDGGFSGTLSGNATSATKATNDGDGNNIKSTYMPKAGGTLTGSLTLKGAAYNYHTDTTSYGLNCNNSDLIGVNSLYFADACDTSLEGIHFYRSATTWDTISANGGTFYFGSNQDKNADSLLQNATIKAGSVYGAVWNDLADAIPVDEEADLDYGYCYCFDGKHYYKSKTYLNKGIIGIHSDTYGFKMGEKKDCKELNCAVAGFVLAYVDKEYESGTPLTCTVNGYLTEMLLEDKMSYPERLVGTYWKPETAEEWGSEDRKVPVNGRHWVKIK